MFSHMAAMYANALYRRGLVKEGYKVLAGIYQHCQDFDRSRIYPGIPEYINGHGRGIYTYFNRISQLVSAYTCDRSLWGQRTAGRSIVGAEAGSPSRPFVALAGARAPGSRL